MSSRFRLALLCGAFFALLLLTLAACAGSTSSRAMPGMSGGMSASSGASAQVVTVTLSDFKIEASQTTFKTGVPYRFVVTNSAKSTANHEFVIVRPMTMAEMDKMTLHRIDASQLPPGATQSFDLTFTNPAPAGQLECACHIGNHYQLGMHTPITVK
jgi:uncharacterized cupredoxin-like copper-binding protein